MKWDKKEMGNQYAHSAIGRGITVLSLIIIGGHAKSIVKNPLLALYIVAGIAVIAFCIKVIQYTMCDNRELKLADRIRDWLFYVVESILLLAVFYWGAMAG